MRSKGFTLIELLAVIVILAIIALIATPIILGIINDTKKGARERSIDNIIHAAEIYYAKEYIKDPKVSNRINIEDIKDEIKGEVPESGYIIINSNGDSIYKVEYKDKVYVKLSTGEIIEEPKNADKYYIKLETTEHSETAPFLGGPMTKEQIEKVTTVPTNKVPSDVIGSFDVTDTTTQSETGKVMAWYYDKDSNGLYEVYIGQEGRVKANPDSTKLFNYLINVTEIDLTYLDTSNVTSMYDMFNRCYKLEKIIGLENFDTSNVTTMYVMFGSCHSLTTLDVSNFDTSNVTDMTGMFQNCTSLKELNVSSFDTSNVESMRLMFAGASRDGVDYYMQLERIIGIEKFDTSKVTDMESMFQCCSSLTTLDVSSFDTSKVTTMKWMFSHCSNLAELKLSSKFDTSQVIDMRRMFQSCSNLTILDLSSFDTSKVTDMIGMFQGCSNLTSMDLKNFDTSKVTDMSYMFYGTRSLKPIYIGENWKTATTTDYMFGGTALTKNESEMCGPNSTHSWCLVTG